MIPEKPLNFKQFNLNWQKDYPWVFCEYQYSMDLKQWQETLYCSYCITYHKYLQEQLLNKEIKELPEKNILILGSTSINKSRLAEHLLQKNGFHLKAESFKFGQNVQCQIKEKEKNGFNKLFSNQKFKASDKLLIPLFYNSYYIAKEDLAILKYESLKQLFAQVEVDQNEAYGSRKFCSQYLDCIHSVLLEDLINELSYHKYFSISIDSTQLQSKKQEIVAITVRFIDSNYQIQSKFLTLKEIPNLKAIGYYETLIESLKELNLLNQLVFLNTDGARVLSSLHQGLAGLLTKKVPFIITTQCIIHKTSLGIKELAKQFQYVKDINYYMYTLASFLNTKKRLDLFAENQKNLMYGDDSDALMLIQPIDVRWISYYPSIERLIKLLLSVQEALYQIQDDNDTPNLRLLIDFFLSFKSILLIASYGDILNPVYILTKQFQKETITLLTIKSDIQTCFDKLDQLRENDGDLIKQLYLRFDINKQDQIILDDFQIMEKQQELFEILEDIQIKKLEMINYLINNLTERFEFTSTVQQFQAFNIEEIRKQRSTELDKFGVKDVESLLTFYQENQFELMKDYTKENILDQYNFSKQRIFQYKQLSINEILQMLHESEFLKDISIFYKLFWLLPITSVECERVFSSVQNIVTKKRAQLDISTIDTLVFISRNGPSIENLKQFNVEKAIQYWKEDKKRKKI